MTAHKWHNLHLTLYPLKEASLIRRLALATCWLVVTVAVPEQSAAAISLALPKSDYPHHTHIVVLPATDAEADHYFGPVHHTSFQRLHRIDGSGWIQAGLWQYSTGQGESAETHRTVFAYGIDVFRSHNAARRALHDVRLRTHGARVDRLYARRFTVSAAQETLIFVFFTYHEILVESYLEYTGAAPAAVSALLQRTFRRQAFALARVARRLDQAIHRPAPRPTVTTLPSPTTGPTSPPPSATAVPTLTPTAPPSATPIPSPTTPPPPPATPTPAGPTLTAVPLSPSVAAGSQETVTATLNAPDPGGVTITMDFQFTGSPTACSAGTDNAGNASCTITVPASTPSGETVTVDVTADLPNGQTLQTETSFTVIG